MNDIRRIWFSPYSLTARRSLGAHASAKPRQGSLLKFEFGSGAIGYADLHPWTELGDRALSEQLKLLSERTLTPLSTRSCEFAHIDAEARASGASVFEGLSIPKSHFLFTEASALTSVLIQEVEAQGFSILKAKVGKNLALESEVLERLFGAKSETKLRLRLDFNSSLDRKQVSEWLLKLSPAIRSKIEFCEDPCPFDAKAWRELQKMTELVFYCDRESEALFESERPDVDGLILKPARQNLAKLRVKSCSVVVTSYLDHPLGQMGASFEAARLRRSRDVGVCGLLSHVAYEPISYSEQLSTRGPELNPSLDEPGFGFSALLESEPWRAL